MAFPNPYEHPKSVGRWLDRLVVLLVLMIGGVMAWGLWGLWTLAHR